MATRRVYNRQLLPVLGQVKLNLGRSPEAASADAGYWSEANATDEGVAGIDLHIATGREKHEETIGTTAEPPPLQATAKQAMRHKLRTRRGDPFTRCAKRSSSQSSARSRSNEASDASVCAGWTMFAVSGNWCA